MPLEDGLCQLLPIAERKAAGAERNGQGKTDPNPESLMQQSSGAVSFAQPCHLTKQSPIVINDGEKALQR